MLDFVFRNRVRLRAIYGPPPAARNVAPRPTEGDEEAPTDLEPAPAKGTAPGTLRRGRGTVLLKPQARRRA